MSTTESDQLKIYVINLGSVWKAKVNNHTKISKVISLAVSHFHGTGIHSSSLKSSKCKLVLVRTKAVLANDKTVAAENLQDHDELLLVEHKATPKLTLPDLRGPTAEEIYEATKHLETRNVDKFNCKLSSAEDDLDYSERFSKDTPRILVSLLETAARLLAFCPNGMEVYHLLKKELDSKREPARHSPYVKQLTDMGFPEPMVLKALTVKRMNVTEATEWLLEQSSIMKESYQQEEASISHTQPATVIEAFQCLIQTALKKRRESFRLNMKHAQQLRSMGHGEENIENALRAMGNNLKAAISWLQEYASCSSPPECNRNLDPSGPMYKALMASEIVQMNMKKPKFLFALLSILEDQQTVSVWLKDREVSDVLNHLILLHNTQSSGRRSII